MTHREYLKELFRDYFNNYLTVEVFANDHEIDVEDARCLLNLGLRYHEEDVETFKKQYNTINN